MQLLREHNILPVIIKDLTMTSFLKDASSNNIEVKEKRSSNGSLRLMNPVASGDNVTNLNSMHKLKEESPSLIPCCEGRELQINQELVRSGLSAISVKHDSVIHCVSMSHACELMQVAPGLVKHRNSFRSLHRPDLKRVPYLRRMSPDELETLFRGYAELPRAKKDKKEDIERMTLPLPPDENCKTTEIKLITDLDDGSGVNPLHPIPETRSGAEDVPAGMRLHGTRAKLYTSVLAGAKAGVQLDRVSTNEEYDKHVPEDTVPEDEVQLTEELQIILPPRCDVTADSSIATSKDSTS
ncbi:uncharacterized protein LOC113518512 [Galleria mellonella]|uniref:Uncharacterized protein LOC113518512 n=1 Tax=Galleria mellonella TaxID=7137 RepID=A0ABM3N2D4_GALME|nr:uncharacterized protein LOC113518512 [Galleria mellonella]